MKLIFNKIYYIIYIEYDIMGSLSSYTSGARYRINKKRFNGIRSASFVCGNEKIKYFFQYYIKNFCENQIMLDIDRGPRFHWHNRAYDRSGIRFRFRESSGKSMRLKSLAKNRIWCFFGRGSGQTEWSRPGELCKPRETLQPSGFPATNICLCSTWNIIHKFT